jgi:hypothetical protein
MLLLQIVAKPIQQRQLIQTTVHAKQPPLAL